MDRQARKMPHEDQKVFDVAACLTELNGDALHAVLGLLETGDPQAAQVIDILEPWLEERGELAGSGIRREPAAWLYGLLGHLAASEREGVWWERVRKLMPVVDRHQCLLNLWQILEREYPKTIEAEHASLAYHRSFLFRWFSQRYDLRRARDVLGLSAWERNLHLLFFVLCLGLLFLRANLDLELRETTYGWAGLMVPAYLALIWIMYDRVRRAIDAESEACLAAVQSLVPRMAASCAVGLVVIASSQELLSLLVEQERPLLLIFVWSIFLLAAAFLYQALETARRLVPTPPLPRLLLMGADLTLTGLAHALALVLVAQSGLAKVLAGACEPVSSKPVPLGWEQSLLLAVFVVAVGIVINLIWADKPVTESL